MPLKNFFTIDIDILLNMPVRSDKGCGDGIRRRPQRCAIRQAKMHSVKRERVAP